MSAAELAQQVRQRFLHQPFGILQIWGFGVWRPNDQSCVLVSTHADGERLDLVYVLEGGFGLPGVISIWDPEALVDAPAWVGQGVAITGASRVRVEDRDATREGEQFRVRTPQGEGVFPIPQLPALILAR